MANFILKPTSSNDSIKFQKSDGTTAIDITGTTATLDSGLSFNGTIGASATITDGANPHGWEHIKTISYSSSVSTASSTGNSKMTDIVSSKYSAYKILAQWGSDDGSTRDLFFRFLDANNTEISTSRYSYGGQIISESGAEGANFNGSGASDAQIGNDLLEGSRGWNGEITLWNCYASTSDYPQIDGHQLASTDTGRPAMPYALFQWTGHDAGNYDMGGHGFFWYDDTLYVNGFQLTWSAAANVCKGSWWSCYGLKLPTAD